MFPCLSITSCLFLNNQLLKYIPCDCKSVAVNLLAMIYAPTPSFNSRCSGQQTILDINAAINYVSLPPSVVNFSFLRTFRRTIFNEGKGRKGMEGKFAPAPSKYIWIDAADSKCSVNSMLRCKKRR